MRTSHKQNASPVVIGWKEVVDLPEWGIRSMVAKSDTGARSSALDVRNIEELEDGMVAFDIALDRHDRKNITRVTAEILKKVRVRSSNGKVQERFSVKTQLKIGRIRKEVVFSLVSRHRMICRILLGRTALSPEFLVDPDNKYLQSKRRRTSVSNPPKHRRHISRKH